MSICPILNQALTISRTMSRAGSCSIRLLKQVASRAGSCSIRLLKQVASRAGSCSIRLLKQVASRAGSCSIRLLKQVASRAGSCSIRLLKQVASLFKTIQRMGNPFLCDFPELLDSRNCVDRSVSTALHTMEETGKKQYQDYVKQDCYMFSKIMFSKIMFSKIMFSKFCKTTQLLFMIQLRRILLLSTRDLI